MDLLKNITQEVSSTRTTGKKRKKFMRRGERAAAEEAHKKPRASDDSSVASSSSSKSKDGSKLSAPLGDKVPNPTKSPLSGDEDDLDEHINDDDLVLMPRHDVIKKLRELGKPVTYFGETDVERQKRMRRAELLHHERETSSQGTRNLFKDVEDEVNKELLDAHAENIGVSADDLAAHEAEKARKKRKYDKARARDEFDTAEDYVLFFLKRILREWEADLEARPTSIKRSGLGKKETMKQKQCRQYIRPLFKLLKHRAVPDDMLPALEKIVQLADQREYLQANDVYLKLSIGNAPWPMGVTMVGIHERSGRAKIFSNQIAHILNDETQRKYIQSMKRLLTFCQQKYPTVGSKSVG